MKKEISPALAGVLALLVVLLVGGLGWYLLNRDTQTIVGGGGGRGDNPKAAAREQRMGEGR